jgi:hypothetical protein
MWWFMPVRLLRSEQPIMIRQMIEKIYLMIDHFRAFKCKKLILISNVDVTKESIGADESTQIDESESHANGLHSRLLEQFVK